MRIIWNHIDDEIGWWDWWTLQRSQFWIPTKTFLSDFETVLPWSWVRGTESQSKTIRKDSTIYIYISTNSVKHRICMIGPSYCRRMPVDKLSASQLKVGWKGKRKVIGTVLLVIIAWTLRLDRLWDTCHPYVETTSTIECGPQTDIIHSPDKIRRFSGALSVKQSSSINAILLVITAWEILRLCGASESYLSFSSWATTHGRLCGKHIIIVNADDWK